MPSRCPSDSEAGGPEKGTGVAQSLAASARSTRAETKCSAPSTRTRCFTGPSRAIAARLGLEPDVVHVPGVVGQSRHILYAELVDGSSQHTQTGQRNRVGRPLSDHR